MLLSVYIKAKAAATKIKNHFRSSINEPLHKQNVIAVVGSVVEMVQTSVPAVVLDIILRCLGQDTGHSA